MKSYTSIASIHLFFLFGLFLVQALKASEERPNILWIVSEDNGCFLGSYGDPNAHTPHLDRLAELGVRYTNFFANAPVCAVARNSWIFGLPAASLGTLHMRSTYAVPRDRFATYPEQLKSAGYYVTNNSKTDYNTRSIEASQIWDESSSQAHYNKRLDPSQPFFAVFNLGQSHESGVFGTKPVGEDSYRVGADAIRVPPYQVRTPEVIQDWRNYYDRITLMDQKVGELLAELKDSGEAKNTIIAYCSDHGGVMLRSKRYLFDSGVRVPLIVHFPEKWKHLAPGEVGSVSNRLVQFIDLPKTWLSLLGADIPETMVGQVFLGEHVEAAPESVFLFSGRFDEVPDSRRGVTDGRWKYIRNFEPDRTRFQMLVYPLRQKGQVSQYTVFEEGRTNAAQSAHYQLQPIEELYDTKIDPDEVSNLSTIEAHGDRLVAMRKKLREHMLQARDIGFIPEPMMESIDQAGTQTIHEFGQSEANYPIDEVIKLATLASTADASNLPTLTSALKHANPIIRHWGAMGLRALGRQAMPAKLEIEEALSDTSSSVRIVAMICLGNLGDEARAGKLLIQEAFDSKYSIERSWALDGLKYLDMPEVIQALSESQRKALSVDKYSTRIIQVLNGGGSSRRIFQGKIK